MEQRREVDMTDKAYLIKNMMMNMAELGAAVQRKYDHPKHDLLTQREAYKFSMNGTKPMASLLRMVRLG